jgi:hypothetical protein
MASLCPRSVPGLTRLRRHVQGRGGEGLTQLRRHVQGQGVLQDLVSLFIRSNMDDLMT